MATCTVVFRTAYGHAVNFAKRHHGRARDIAGHIDRGLSTAYKIYQHLALAIAPRTRRALGDRADDIHKHIVDGALLGGPAASDPTGRSDVGRWRGRSMRKFVGE